MVFGNIRNLKEYAWLAPRIQACFVYAQHQNLLDFAPGRHEIDADRLFVNIVQYETTLPENRFWEAHRQYLDLHLMLRGNEQIDLNFIENLTQRDYVPKDDFLPLDGEPNSHVVLTDGDFLLCYPADAHRTAVQVNGPETIKKAIFKIQIPETGF